MKHLRLLSNLTKLSTLRNNLRTLRLLPRTLSARSNLSMTLKYNFSSDKEDIPEDYSKNKVQGKQKGQQYQSIQLKTACLGLFSYIIVSGNQAAIIDPLNQIDQYLKILKQKNVQLKYIFLTHFHADFISGQTDLLKLYPDTKIVMGPKAKTEAYKVQTLEDGNSIKIGNVWLEAFHTPGHTLESTCYILKTKEGIKEAVYSGDTVFIGEVGRPDLAAKSNVKPQQLAKILYKSIQKFKTLPDTLTVYPTHGAGSSCGKNMSHGDKTTVGCEKSKSYAFKAQTEEDFVKQLLKDMPQPPNYYFNSVETNKQHPFDFDQEFHKAYKPLTPEEFESEMKKSNSIVLDVRSDNNQFYHGLIKGAYFVGNQGPLANFVGTLFKPTDHFLIFGNPNQTEEATKRLLRIGYTNIKGYNDFDLDEWKGETLKYKQGTSQDLNKTSDGKTQYTILDLRTLPQLQKQGVFKGNNVNVPIQKLKEYINEKKLPKDKKYLAHCASGYRSKIAATILQNAGYDFTVLADSWKSYQEKGAKVVPKP